MTLAREMIDAMKKETVAHPWAATGSPSFAMPATDAQKLLAALRTLAERGPSEGMFERGERSENIDLYFREQCAVTFCAMLRALLAEIEEEKP